MRILPYLFTAIILVASTCSCNRQKTYRIGISQCSSDDWRNKMNEEIEREAMFHSDIDVEIRTANDDNATQIADIQYFIDNDFDIIIASPNEAASITPILSRAYDDSIPVIIFDRSVQGDKYTAFIGADNVGMGRMAAQYATNLCDGKAHILEIRGLDGSTPAAGRHQGFVNAIADNPSMVIAHSANGKWNYDDALRVADSVFAIDPNINLVYAHNDRMAIAARNAATEHGMFPNIIGIDAAPSIGIQAVADSVIDASFIYPTEGHRLIRTALDILNGRPFDRITLVPIPSAVDKSNADILLMQNEALNDETDKMRQLKTQIDDYWTKHSAQTSLFYASITILVLLCGLLFLILRAYWQRRMYQDRLLAQNKELEQQRDLQKQLNQQLSEATHSKLVFFTNVSHDLRTPLTLIAEPVEQLVKADNLTSGQRTLMQIANKNVRILRRLLNQILDFRKYENGMLDLNLSEVQLSALMADWTQAFNTIARSRDIKLSVDIATDSDTTVAVDTEKIERVLFNLMSNAFKYTPDNGKITFRYRATDKTITFSISDTGKGIGAEDLTHIFERFYQVEKVRPTGSGIGLSLVKAFVELHDGKIDVVSTPGQGSTFTVTLPVRHVEQSAPAEIPAFTAEDVNAELGRIDTLPEIDENDTKPLLLAIDDNADIRKMLSELLHNDYNVITADSGAQGLRMAAKYVPDLIICDVMMPGMDGFECCQRLKNEISTSHIPVLLLTACALDNQRVDGYESGADGYITKPFSAEVLKARCSSLIENRRRIRQLWQSSAPGIASEVTSDTPIPQPPSAGAPATISDTENEFYTKFLRLARERMSDPDLSVDTLAAEMGLGRSQFYRKIKALTNYSPVELLRRLRLNTARHLLTTTDKTISEIAYEVGFSTPAYFTKCYREAFDQTPSQLRDSLS